MKKPLLLGFLFTLTILAAEFREVTAPGFRIVTDGPERQARELLDLARQMQVAFPGAAAAPLEIVVLSKDQRFERLGRGSRVAALYQYSGTTNRIILSDLASDRTFRHEFVHFALGRFSANLPTWLEEGLAEYYSTIEIRRGELTAGHAVPGHAGWLRANGVRSLAELLAYTHEKDGPELYAAAWALVHMLRNGDGYAGRFGEFWSRVQQGGRVNDVLPAVFGKPLKEIELDLAAYILRPAYPVERLPQTAPLAVIERVEARRLDADAFDEEYADVLRAVGRVDEAYRLMERSPRAGSQVAARALRAIGQERWAEARKELEKSGLATGTLAFEYAGVLRSTGGTEAEIMAALRQAVEWNPRHTEAQLWLALLLGRRGEWAQAEASLARAAESSPRRFDVWYELAFARRELSRPEGVRAAAERALAAARSDQEREKARALAAGPASPARVARPAAVRSGEAWKMPAGDRVVEGDWTALACGDVAVLRVRTPAAAGGEEWLIRDPSKVSLRNAGAVSFEFRCGEQSPVRRVRLEVDSSSREVRAIEFLGGI